MLPKRSEPSRARASFASRQTNRLWFESARVILTSAAGCSLLLRSFQLPLDGTDQCFWKHYAHCLALAEPGDRAPLSVLAPDGAEVQRHHEAPRA